MAINLNFKKLPWYGQVGAFVVLALVSGGAFWKYYAQAAQQDIDTRQAQLLSIRADLDRGRRTARELPQFRARVAALEGQLADLSRQLPEEQDVADLLRRVQGMATESSLTIRGFTPQAVSRKQLHMEWPIGLKLEGRYHDIGAFLERVSKFPRIINVGNIKIHAIDNAASGVTVTADCTATTFVMIDAAKTPAPGGAAAPGAKAARDAGNPPPSLCARPGRPGRGPNPLPRLRQRGVRRRHPPRRQPRRRQCRPPQRPRSRPATPIKAAGGAIRSSACCVA